MKGSSKNAKWAPFFLSETPYQETCLESRLNALKGQGLSSSWSWKAHGFRISAGTVTRIVQKFSTRSLIAFNSVELARQAADQARKLFPHWSVKIEQEAWYIASGSLTHVF